MPNYPIKGGAALPLMPLETRLQLTAMHFF